jgi:hypothetical protein
MEMVLMDNPPQVGLPPEFLAGTWIYQGNESGRFVCMNDTGAFPAYIDASLVPTCEPVFGPIIPEIGTPTAFLAPPEVAAVPEPSALALIALGAVLVARRAARRRA